MIISRNKFFLVAAATLLLPMLVPKMIWLTHTRHSIGVMAFEGRGGAGDQIPLSYSVVYFKLGKDTIWFNGLGNLHLHPGDSIPIRFKTANPSDAKVDIFAGIWGDTLVYGGIPTLMLLVMFLHPTLVPRRSKLKLTMKKPFIWIV